MATMGGDTSSPIKDASLPSSAEHKGRNVAPPASDDHTSPQPASPPAADPSSPVDHKDEDFVVLKGIAPAMAPDAKNPSPDPVISVVAPDSSAPVISVVAPDGGASAPVISVGAPDGGATAKNPSSAPVVSVVAPDDGGPAATTGIVGENLPEFLASIPITTTAHDASVVGVPGPSSGGIQPAPAIQECHHAPPDSPARSLRRDGSTTVGVGPSDGAAASTEGSDGSVRCGAVVPLAGACQSCGVCLSPDQCVSNLCGTCTDDRCMACMSRSGRCYCNCCGGCMVLTGQCGRPCPSRRHVVPVVIDLDDMNVLCRLPTPPPVPQRCPVTIALSADFDGDEMNLHLPRTRAPTPPPASHKPHSSRSSGGTNLVTVAEAPLEPGAQQPPPPKDAADAPVSDPQRSPKDAADAPVSDPQRSPKDATDAHVSGPQRSPKDAPDGLSTGDEGNDVEDDDDDQNASARDTDEGTGKSGEKSEDDEVSDEAGRPPNNGSSGHGNENAQPDAGDARSEGDSDDDDDEDDDDGEDDDDDDEDDENLKEAVNETRRELALAQLVTVLAFAILLLAVLTVLIKLDHIDGRVALVEQRPALLERVAALEQHNARLGDFERRHASLLEALGRIGGTLLDSVDGAAAPSSRPSGLSPCSGPWTKGLTDRGLDFGIGRCRRAVCRRANTFARPIVVTML